MRFIRFFTLGVVSVLVIFSAIVWILLPSQYTIEEKVVIEAPVRKVFGKINTLSEWQEWALGNDPSGSQFQFKIEGPLSGEGSIYRWQSEAGDGVLQIIDSEPFDRITLKAVMQQGQFESDIFFLCEYQKPYTVVTWTEYGNFGWNPLTRLTASMLDFAGTMEKNYRKSLDKLKEVTEAGN